MKPVDENARLKELHSLNILDTPPEERFDRHTRLASTMFNVPTVFITFVDRDRVWFKSCIGCETQELRREDTLCHHTLGQGFLEIQDTFADEFFRDHPVVKGTPPIRFYAAYVLHGPTGQPIGTLCLVDYVPRRLNENYRRLLEAFTRLVESEIERDTAIKIDRQILRDATLRDSNTGLPSEKLLKETLESLIKAGREQLAIMHFCVGNFDPIASLHGSDGLNTMMQTFVDRLVFSQETILGAGKIGPDRLALIVPAGSKESVLEMAERILGTLTEPVEFKAYELHPEISVGISVYPADGKAAGPLIDLAQRACSFSAFPSDIQFYDASGEAGLARRYLIKERLAMALINNQITLNYQPIWQADGSQIKKFEALARWQDEVLGVVSPGEFVPVAEKHTGLSRQLTYYVLRMACMEARTWQTVPGQEPLRVAVNIPAAEFYQPDFAGSVLALLNEVGLEPSRLSLELTEESLVQNIEQTIRTMAELSGTGVRLALDDFGTGYSSLNHLNRLPVDTLKIDKSFIDALPDSKKGVQIVSGFIRIVHAMGMVVVAEGVEHRAQQKLLLDYDCDLIQGYLLGRPITADQVHELLENMTGREKWLAVCRERWRNLKGKFAMRKSQHADGIGGTMRSPKSPARDVRARSGQRR